jgi:hypothetical protein
VLLVEVEETVIIRTLLEIVVVLAVVVMEDFVAAQVDLE